MGILGRRATFSTIASIDSATFTGSYQTLGTLTQSAVLIKLVNNSNQLVTVSYDGANDNDILPSASATIYDFGANAQDVSGSGRLSIPSGTVVRVKGSAGVGLVYLVTVYAGQ